MVICVPVPGDALFTNSPSVILEVLSPHTRRNDEIQKFRDDLTLPSLETSILAEAGISLSLAELYRDVG